jgi:hypothetical protein
MCGAWTKLADEYTRALNAHKVAMMSLPKPRARGYKVAWLKKEILKKELDTALIALQEHQRKHGC